MSYERDTAGFTRTGEATAVAVEPISGKKDFDQGRAAAFEEQMVDTVSKGAVALMISVGHRTGLFDAMESGEEMTSEQLAGRANLNERYVREWLAAMYSADIIEHDPESGCYSLPAEHAACLTRASTPNNIAVFAQYIPVMGSVEDDIVECFRNGGGVGYEKFTGFHRVMAEDSGQTVLPVLLDKLLPLVPGIVERLERGIEVADFGCGRGKALLVMAEQFPRSSFTGYDLSEEAIGEARREAQSRGLGNLRFIARDLTDIQEWVEPGSLDLAITFDAVHDQKKPLNLLKGINLSLKDDGYYLMQDIRGHSHVHLNRDNPFAALLYTVSCMHCMTVSLAQGGDGLGTMWGREKASELLSEAGFGSVVINELEHDPMNDFYAISK